MSDEILMQMIRLRDAYHYDKKNIMYFVMLIVSVNQ